MNLCTLTALASISVLTRKRKTYDPSANQTSTEHSGISRPGMTLEWYFRFSHFQCYLMKLRPTRFGPVVTDPLNTGGLWFESWYLYRIRKEPFRITALTQRIPADFISRSSVHPVAYRHNTQKDSCCFLLQLVSACSLIILSLDGVYSVDSNGQ